jgi:hypothetical protein
MLLLCICVCVHIPMCTNPSGVLAFLPAPPHLQQQRSSGGSTSLCVCVMALCALSTCLSVAFWAPANPVRTY